MLAPMDGYSDHPFRSLARSLGSAMSYSEFINGKDVMDGHPFLSQRLYFSEDERPVVFQLLDDDPQRILSATARLAEYQPDIFDVNLGCPSRSVTHRGAGARLLQDPAKIAMIISSLSSSFPQPVTAKIRLGWDEEQNNYLDLAKVIEDSGARMIAVHARTKKQMYEGKANWEAIARIKQCVQIPVIGNGDVKCVADIRRMRESTGCDGIMIGRAAIANPWLFQERDRWEISTTEMLAVLHGHLENMRQFYDPKIGFLFFKKFIAKFIEPYAVERADRRDLLTKSEPEVFLAKLDTMVMKEQKNFIKTWSQNDRE